MSDPMWDRGHLGGWFGLDIDDGDRSGRARGASSTTSGIDRDARGSACSNGVTGSDHVDPEPRPFGGDLDDVIRREHRGRIHLRGGENLALFRTRSQDGCRDHEGRDEVHSSPPAIIHRRPMRAFNPSLSLNDRIDHSGPASRAAPPLQTERIQSTPGQLGRDARHHEESFHAARVRDRSRPSSSQVPGRWSPGPSRASPSPSSDHREVPRLRRA